MRRTLCLTALSGANTEFPDTIDFVVHENTAAHMASADCDDGAGFEGGSIKNCEGAAAGRSAAETAAAYAVPDEYSDFQAPANRVEQIVGLIYEGR